VKIGTAGRRGYWPGERHAEWTASCVDDLLRELPRERLVWGGDWNHAMTGPEWAGSIGGRGAIVRALEKLDLRVPTADLPHRIEGLLSIDHVAVPRGTVVGGVGRHEAVDGDLRRLSDHDAYVVEIGAATG